MHPKNITSTARPGGISDAEIAVIIPARLAASRLPGKPLAIIGDAPMIVQVMRRAMEAGFGQPGGSRVVVACDDASIAEAVTAHGGEAVMTDPQHPSGSDRVHEAIDAIDPDGRIRVVINLQGDLPEIDASILWPLADALIADNAAIATPVAPATEAEIGLDQVVKAVIAFPHGDPASVPDAGSTGQVLYFSRCPVPHGGTTATPVWHHVGIYAWQREALARFVSLPPSPLEKTERLEQLRALEDGMAITALVVDSAPGGIDTPDDLAAARLRFE